MNSGSVLANLSMLFVTFIWGSTYIVIKNCIHDVPVLPFFFYRFLVASLVMGALLLFLRKKPFQSLKKGIALGMLLLAGCLFQTFALVQVSATNAAFIGSLFVFFVPFFNFLIFRKKPQKNIIAPIVLVCIGLWNITGGIHEIGYGELLALLSPIAFAIYILYIDNAVKTNDIWVLNFQQFMVIAIASFLLSLIFKSSFELTTPQSLFGITYLAVIASVITLALQFKAQKSIHPFHCALILSLEPLFAAIFAKVLGGEVLMLQNVIGGVFIISAIVMVQLGNKRPPSFEGVARERDEFSKS